MLTKRFVVDWIISLCQNATLTATPYDIIYTTVVPDHSATTVFPTSTPPIKRGPGFWKFNSSLIKENEFTDSLEEKISEFVNKFSYLQDKGLCWPKNLEFYRRVTQIL